MRPYNGHYSNPETRDRNSNNTCNPRTTHRNSTCAKFHMCQGLSEANVGLFTKLSPSVFTLRVAMQQCSNATTPQLTSTIRCSPCWRSFDVVQPPSSPHTECSERRAPHHCRNPPPQVPSHPQIPVPLSATAPPTQSDGPAHRGVSQRRIASRPSACPPPPGGSAPLPLAGCTTVRTPPPCMPSPR